MKTKSYISLIVVLVVIGGAWILSTFFYQLMIIRGESMSPSYHNMQLVILDKYSKDYIYGDVIAFHCEGLGEVLVKRIVACPGDSVVIENGILYVNGQISSVFPDVGIFTYSGLAKDEIKLAAHEYFVIGDNISESKDSRYAEVGSVYSMDIKGEILSW